MSKKKKIKMFEVGQIVKILRSIDPNGKYKGYYKIRKVNGLTCWLEGVNGSWHQDCLILVDIK